MTSVDSERRRLLKGLMATATWPALGLAAPLSKTAPAAPLAELNYGQVQFGAGPLQRQGRENHQLLLGLDEDSLLLPYRRRAGQRARGDELGGWYNTYGFAPGATFGQWMSALSRYYAITGDGATRDKVRRLVRGYAATLDEQGSFYKRNRFPCYTYDKLVGGLLDASRLGRDETALLTLARATQAVAPHLPPHVMPRNESNHVDEYSHYSWDESYTLPENQFLAWGVTADARHLDIGRRMLYDPFFSALARGDNVLPGKHAYSHVNALSSAAQAYVALGNPIYLEAARRGFEMIAAQSFATGGWGPDEHFIEPGGGGLGASLEQQRNSFETPCGAYAHFKLTRHLLKLTRDSRYGDSMERVMYNTVLGALPIQPDGHAFYYSDYSGEARKGFHTHRWPCCSGTLPMLAADYGISTCLTDEQGLYVNLYVPAAVTWFQDGAACVLSIETDYPYEDKVAFTLGLPAPRTFTLNLRIPAWAANAQLRINGCADATPLVPGRFAAVRREWRSADRLELTLPLTRSLQSVDALHPDTVALMQGPLVLMRIIEGDGTPLITREKLLAARRGLEARAWIADSVAGPVRLKGFPDIAADTYSAYQRVLPS